MNVYLGDDSTDQSLGRHVILGSIAAFAATAGGILVGYANWSAPLFDADFFREFGRYPWFRVSFATAVATVLFPFCAVSPAWARRSSPGEAAGAYARGFLPILLLSLAPLPYPNYRPYSDTLNGYAIFGAIILNGVVSYFIARRVSARLSVVTR